MLEQLAGGVTSEYPDKEKSEPPGGGEGDSEQCPEIQSECCSAGVWMTVGQSLELPIERVASLLGKGCALES